MIAALHADGLKPSYLRKIAQATAMVFDQAGVTPNPARDKQTVRMPHDRKSEFVPPTTEHVEAAYAVLPARYQLPLLVLDATGMRLGELEHLAWGDVDEPRRRWRVSAAVSKTKHARISRRCSTSAPARIARQSGACSRGSAATGSVPPSLERPPRRACQRSRRMTCATAA